MVKLAKNAEEKLRAAFLPFTSGVHLCTVKFSDREHGSFCYELVGQALPPSICAENEFVMDLNRPVTAYLQVGATNQQLEAAKKTFMEGHPLAKKKELVQMLTVQRPSVLLISHWLPAYRFQDLCLVHETSEKPVTGSNVCRREPSVLGFSRQ